MNPRSTALLFLLAAALGAFVYFYEIKGGEQRKEDEAVAKRLYPGVDAQAVEWIALQSTDGKAVEAERSEGRWKITKPLAALGDPVALDGMASALAEVQSEATLDAPQGPEVYGLGEGAKVVRFRANAAEHTLRVGKRTPVGPNSYASADDPAKIVTIPTYRASSFDRAFDDMRERRILRFDQSAIHALELRFRDERVAVERAEAGWRLHAPLEGPGDETTIEKLLSDLSYLRAEGFLDDATPDEKVGLDKPELVVELRAKPTSEGATPASFKLTMGPPLAGDEKHRALRAGDGTLYTVAVERIVDVPRNVTAYRFKDVAKFMATDAQRIQLTFHDPMESQPVVVELNRTDDAGWKLAGDGELMSGKPTRLVAELARLRAEDILAETPTEVQLKELGLAPPAALVRVFAARTAQDEPLLAEVAFGRSDPQGLVAKAAAGEAVYRLGPELREHLPASLAVWREKFVSTAPAMPAAPAAPIAPADADAEGDGNADPSAEEMFPPSAPPPGAR